MSRIIEVEDLSFGYESASAILDGISFGAAGGSFTAIAGPNGAGKSTLLNLLAGTLKRRAGSIMIDGAAIESYNSRTLAQRIAVVRQEFVPAFGFSVVETVMMARTAYFGATGFESKADAEIVDEALRLTDTTEFVSRPLGQLSGGERQWVFIARALAQDTPILLLDEPTSFLDLKHQVGIYDLLKKMQRQMDKTIVVVTHDINLAAQYADEVLLLRADGKGYDIGGPEEVLQEDRIKATFGVDIFSGRFAGQNFFVPVGKLGKGRDISKPDKNFSHDM